MERLLCIGFLPYDVVHLRTVARRARDTLGLEPVFVTAPSETRAGVQTEIAAAGFEVLDRPLAATDDPSIRNPIERYRGLRTANLRLIDALLADVRPAAILASVNAPPGLLLDEAARRGIPAILLQMFFWGDRAFYREWYGHERSALDEALSPKNRRRRRLKRRVEAFYGVGQQHLVWDLRRATIAVQGPALRRRLVAERVPEKNVVVTGNPALDDLYQLRQAPDEARVRVRGQLGVANDVEIVTHLRSYEDRLFTLDKTNRDQSQVQIISALRAAAPEAQVVVKIHPREGEAERAVIRSIDDRVLVVGDEVSTNELIVTSQVNVGTISTTLLQSVALDRPTVSAFLWSGVEYWRSATNWSGVDRVDDPRALTEAVRRHLGDQQYQYEWSARRDAFIKEEFLLDGQGANRVVDLIERQTRSGSDAVIARRR